MKNAIGQLNVVALLKGIVLASVCIIMFAVILAVVTFATTWQQSYWVLNIFTYVSIFVGACYVGLKSEHKIGLTGIIYGIIFFLAISIISGNMAITGELIWFKQLLIVAGISVFGSIIGGFLQK